MRAREGSGASAAYQYMRVQYSRSHHPPHQWTGRYFGLPAAQRQFDPLPSSQAHRRLHSLGDTPLLLACRDVRLGMVCVWGRLWLSTVAAAAAGVAPRRSASCSFFVVEVSARGQGEGKDRTSWKPWARRRVCAARVGPSSCQLIAEPRARLGGKWRTLARTHAVTFGLCQACQPLIKGMVMVGMSFTALALTRMRRQTSLMKV